MRRRPAAAPAPAPARRMRELELITARLIRAGFAGEYHAAFHGQGVEFAQVREYQPGDDIRAIDWNVTARSGIPHVKEFVEERDLTVVVALDASASMNFGSIDRRKIDVATEIVSVLAIAAEKNGDRAGLLVFGAAERILIPPRKGMFHARRIVRSALGCVTGPAGRGSMEDAVRQLHRLLPKRAVVVVISDFLGDSGPEPLRRLALRHDLIAVRVTDPREERLPRKGIVTVVDRETGEKRSVDLAHATSDRAPLDYAGTLMRRGAVDILDISTAEPWDRPLMKFFETRIRRRD